MGTGNERDAANGAAYSSAEPVCLIHGDADGLRVADEGVQLLEALHEPVAVICLAGQYRTGKSFFLNHLARDASLSNSDSNCRQDGNGKADTMATEVRGFQVGPTTESCTRGIWLWDPQPTVRNSRGERVLFMDTEGIAATDNDESYDAKIFSLGLLLSSLFVFNTMGVIDEGAIDRLFLVSELTKHVCVSSSHSIDPEASPPLSSSSSTRSLSRSHDEDTHDDMAESRELAPHFPPFVWLLRDFMLDMQADGSRLTANEYLENALAHRDSTGASRRHDERNRIRASIRILFDRRECLTLVRPVVDERQLRFAAELTSTADGLRPEFVEQMQTVRARIMSIVAAKRVFNKVVDGRQLAYLVRCYTETMNSGAIPDIKAAWAYVSEATCQSAMLTAMDVYDKGMTPASPVSAHANGTMMENGEDAEMNNHAAASTETHILTQQEFEKLHKEAQDEALTVFKSQSVEGATRAACFQKLKQHIQKHRTALIASLQSRSMAQCERVLRALHSEFLVQRMEAGAWDDIKSVVLFDEVMTLLEDKYDALAQGPAKKAAMFTFLRTDAVAFFQSLFQRLLSRHEHAIEDAEKRHSMLERSKETLEHELKQQLQERVIEITRLEAATQHGAEKERMHLERIGELLRKSEQQQSTISTLEEKQQQQVSQFEELKETRTGLERQLEKMSVQATHTQEALQSRDEELCETKRAWQTQVEELRRTQQDEKEVWIQKLADQTSERSTLQKTLKQRDNEAQHLAREMDILRKENAQLAHVLKDEQHTRQQSEAENTRLRDLNTTIEQRLDNASASQAKVRHEAERDRARLEQRLERFQTQLGRASSDRVVEETLRECVNEVVRLAEVEKVAVLLEERKVLQERLGDLFLKISTLPEFYQREIFCSPEPMPSFFDALTQ